MTNSFSSSSSKDTVTPHCEQRLYSTVGNNCTTLSGMAAPFGGEFREGAMTERRHIQMRHRFLGNDRLEVSAVGLGCMGFTQSYPPYPDRKEAIAPSGELSTWA